jgi:multisubunit Na+/H+ antiporter MnhB subunit
MVETIGLTLVGIAFGSLAAQGKFQTRSLIWSGIGVLVSMVTDIAAHHHW